MKKFGKRIIGVCLALLMLLSLLPMLAISALADEGGEVAADKTKEPVTIVNGDYSLTVNKTVFEVGEPIYVTASGPNAKDWVGFYNYDASGSLFWQYVDSMGDGKTVNFSAGKNIDEGEYVIRLQANDSSNFSESRATVKIKVGNPKTGIKGDSSVFSIEKFTYNSGEPIYVTANSINSDSWVGIYRFDSYGKTSTAWHWINNPNKGGNEINAGEGVAYDVTQGKALEPGVYMIYLFPNSATNMSAVVASACVTVLGDYAISYEALLGDGSEVEPEEPVQPDPEPDPEPKPEPEPEPDPDPEKPEGDENEGEDDDGITFEESGKAVKITNGEFELCVNKTVFEVGEPILVSGKGPNEQDWIGIYRIQDNATIMYQYLGNVGNGVWFDITENCIEGHFYNSYSSLPEGEYVIRLQENAGDNYKDSRALVRIKIGNPEKTVFGDSSLLSVDKLTYKPGEPIMVTPHMVEGYTDSWVGIYHFDNYQRGASTQWEWVKTNGDGVPYDVTEGKTLDEGIYLIRLLPCDTGDMSITAAYVMVTVGDTKAVSYDSIVTDSTVGEAPMRGAYVSNETHSMSTNKTRYEVGEEIWVTAVGVGSKDWIGIAQRDSRDATIRWYYVSDAGNGTPYDVRTAPNIGGTLSALKDIPEGLYTVYLVENDQYLKNDFTFSINIAVGDIDDPENGKTIGGTEAEPDMPTETQAPSGATYTPSANGFAGGTLSVTMPYGIVGGYDIVTYWSDENGALSGYTAVATFKVNAETTSFIFPDGVVIPKGATKLLVYAKKSGESTPSTGYVTVDLPSGAAMDSLGTPDLSMVVISDVHIKGSLSDTSAVNFQNMLRDVIALHPNGAAIYIVGDIADNGQAGQYANAMTLYNAVLTETGAQASNYPMFFAIGNHDYPAANGAFLEYATLPDGTHPTDTSYDFWLNGYHYIFLGSDTPSGLNAYFNADTLAWLDEKLNENRDPSRPTFVFLHQSLYNTVSGSLPGEGWHGVTNDSELRAILSKYPEIMFFNGHSHWTMDSKGNMYVADESLPFNVFNCASVSYLWSGYNKVSGEHLDGSQGYIVEIYGNKIYVRGRDFANGAWVSAAQYLVALPEPECEHSYEITDVEYANGYMQDGTATKVCTGCGKTLVEGAPALIVNKGYSVAEYGVSSVTVSYSVNYEAIALYEQINNTKIDLGVVACASGNLTNADNKPINTDGTSASVNSGMVANSKVDKSFACVSIIMRTSSWEKYANLEMIMCLYVIENDTVWYASSEALTEVATTVTYNGILSEQGEEE